MRLERTDIITFSMPIVIKVHQNSRQQSGQRNLVRHRSVRRQSTGRRRHAGRRNRRRHARRRILRHCPMQLSAAGRHNRRPPERITPRRVRHHRPAETSMLVHITAADATAAAGRRVRRRSVRCCRPSGGTGSCSATGSRSGHRRRKARLILCLRRQSPQYARSQTGRLFQPLAVVPFAIAHVVRFLQDDVPIVRRVVVHLEDRAEPMRPYQVDGRYQHPSAQAQNAGNQHQPKTPAQSEFETSAFEDDCEWSLWQKHVIADGGQDEQSARYAFRVGTVAWHRNQQQVHEHPRGEGGPAKKRQLDGLFVVISKACSLTYHSVMVA